MLELNLVISRYLPYVYEIREKSGNTPWLLGRGQARLTAKAERVVCRCTVPANYDNLEPRLTRCFLGGALASEGRLNHSIHLSGDFFTALHVICAQYYILVYSSSGLSCPRTDPF